MDENKCQVIEISRGTTHDGPGMRTTIFLKGCPLNCLWCQNPEGINPRQDIWWEERKCIRCLSCVAACPLEGIAEQADGLHLDRERCTLCGECVEACPSRAMAFTGQEWGLERLVKEALKDKEYYQAFGGGVTVSGGEPLSQYRFVAQFFKRLHEAGVHTALDTCGMASSEALRAVLPYTDAVLFDIKLLDDALHQQYTGQSNQRILDNLAFIANYMRQARRDEGRALRLWIRTPLIPGATATAENLAAIGAFIHAHLSDLVERWELCAFNPACKSKYKKMDQAWVYEEYALLAQGEVERLKAAALSTGVGREKLVVSGLIAR